MRYGRIGRQGSRGLRIADDIPARGPEILLSVQILISGERPGKYRYDSGMKSLSDSPVQVRVRRMKHAEGLELPAYATQGAAGADVRAAESCMILPGERHAVSTGLIMEIPPGFEIQVRPRSGLAWKQGLTVVNAPGTIDSDYRGELRVLLINLGSEPVEVERGERVAQLILSPVLQADFREVSEVGVSDRGEGGFGSTGRR